MNTATIIEYYKTHTLKELYHHFDMSEAGMVKRLKKYGITKESIKPTKQEVIEFYKTHTQKETLNHFGFCKATLHNKVKGTYKLQRYLCPDTLTPDQEQILIGSLLGDGCLTKRYCQQYPLFVERHCSQQLPYLEWKHTMLQPFSRDIQKETQNTFNKERNSYRYETVRHPLFCEWEHKWYKRDASGDYILSNERRIKQIPTDLTLTPLSIAVWYCDDGRNIPSRRTAYISTDGFSYDECMFLQDKLMSFGIKSKPIPTRQKCQYELYIGPRSYFDFIDLTKGCIPRDILPYKFDLSKVKPYKRKRRLCHEDTN